MRIEYDVKLDFKDVLIRPKRSTLTSRSEVDLLREYTFKYGSVRYSGIPIVASNMDHTGTLQMAKALAKRQLMTALDKFLKIETRQSNSNDSNEWPSVANTFFISSGIGHEELERLPHMLDATHGNYICLDVANGYTQRFVDVVKKTRARFPSKVIMAGNVVTSEMTEELILAGADIVKVGIGPGSVCTTREKTGVGYPQLSAIIECADAAHGLGGHLCADGGCTSPGDIAKAFAAGADFVMLGGMFAGHDECSGELITKGDKRFKRFYGMSSSEAMQVHFGGINPYRAAEGKSVDVPHKGPVDATVNDMLGGLRSACTYVGAQKLKELSKRTTFVRVSEQLNEVFQAFEAESQ
jgi:GMP reductase